MLGVAGAARRLAVIGVVAVAVVLLGEATSTRAARPERSNSTGTTRLASGAQPTPTAQPTDGGEAELLAQGAAVFSRTCTSCHQVGGVGIPGQFPPLKGNSNARDAAYVEQVVRNGRRGRIVVNGVTYDGTMPPVGTSLSDEELSAVVAYVAADLTLPPGAEVAEAPVPLMPGPPAYSLALFAVGFLVAAGVGAVVVGPLVLGATDRVHLSWVDAALKSAVIVGYFVIATVVVPGEVMASEQIASLPRNLQYVIGSAVWGGGVLVGLAGLWWAHRRNRI